MGMGPATRRQRLSVGGGADGAFSVGVESDSAGDIRAVRISPDGARALSIFAVDAAAWLGVAARPERSPCPRYQAAPRRLRYRCLMDVVNGRRAAVQTGTGEADQFADDAFAVALSSAALPIHDVSMSAGASSASGHRRHGRGGKLRCSSTRCAQNAPVSLTSARYAG